MIALGKPGNDGTGRLDIRAIMAITLRDELIT